MLIINPPYALIMWIKSIKYFILPLLLLNYSNIVAGQESNSKNNQLEFIFYNVENLFDLENDSLTNDEEFIANGIRNWNKYRLDDKIKKLSRAILAANDWKPSAIVGLCEIENRKVLELLLEKSLLRKYNYDIIHKDSKDLRGIDVAIIYDTTRLQVDFIKYYTINLKGRPTRDILYTKFIYGKDSFHVLVNHWPSRYSGTLQSESSRLIASMKLKSICDSIFITNKMAKLIIMGDFNDNPTNKSLKSLCEISEVIGESYLVNLMNDMRYGTHKFHGIWSVFDQFIISKVLIEGLRSEFEVNLSVSQVKFLYEKDEKYLGIKPFRTFYGFKYNGGYSDHIPILLRLRSLK